MRAWVLALLLVASGLAGCIGSDPAPEAGDELTAATLEEPLDVDPSELGEMPVERVHYEFGYTRVSNGGSPQTYPAKLNGSIHYPSEGEGPFPVVLFQHGRHSTCAVGPSSEEAGTPVRVLGTHACPNAEPVAEPVDSYQGYAYLAENLASHGYVVASVNTNDVNDRDAHGDYGAQARAQLLLRTLDRLERLDEGEDPSQAGGESAGDLADALEGRLAMDEIGLVGHSRGGEGVVHAVEYNENREQGTPHAIDAVFAIAPIDATDSIADGVDLAVLLPYCDGDVSSLSGAEMYDRHRYETSGDHDRYQFLAMGANHNAYNTVWDEHSDDASYLDDAYCGSYREEGGGRLSSEDQRRHAEVLIPAFLRVHVGDETELSPVLDGRTHLPASACPTDLDECPHVIHRTHHPPTDQVRVIEDTRGPQTLSSSDLGSSVEFEGFANASTCDPEDCPGQPNVQGAHQLTLTWRKPGAAYRIPAPGGSIDLSEATSLALRVGVNVGHEANPDDASQDASLVLADAEGNRDDVDLGNHSDALFYPPGSNPDSDVPSVYFVGPADDNAKVTLNQVRVPLEAFEDVDTTRVSEISLVFDETPSGSVQLTDLMLVE